MKTPTKTDYFLNGLSKVLEKSESGMTLEFLLQKNEKSYILATPFRLIMGRPSPADRVFVSPLFFDEKRDLNEQRRLDMAHEYSRVFVYMHGNAGGDRMIDIDAWDDLTTMAPIILDTVIKKGKK